MPGGHPGSQHDGNVREDGSPTFQIGALAKSLWDFNPMVHEYLRQDRSAQTVETTRGVRGSHMLPVGRPEEFS